MVQPGDIAPARLGERAVAGVHRSAILGQCDQPDPRVGPAGDDVARFVGRTIVDDQQLEIGEALIGHAGQRLRQERGAVIRRHDDADGRRGHAAARASRFRT